MHYGLDKEKQMEMWQEGNPLEDRRRNLALAEAGGPPALLRCWTDEAATRPAFPDISASLSSPRGTPVLGVLRRPADAAPARGP